MIVSMPDARRCIVVGAGLLGLSTTHELTRRGWQVVVLEAGATVGHGRSGSKGDARIFRLGYPQRHYVALALRAAALWRDLELETGRQLLRVCGQLTFGEAEDLHAIAAALDACGAPVEKLSTEEAAQRFPALRPGTPAIVEPDSGVLAAGECLRALCDEERFTLCTSTPVTAIEPRADGARVWTTDGEMFEADVVVCCAGARTLGLLGLDTKVAAAASLPQVAYFETTGAMPPIFIEWGPDMFYGLPVTSPGPNEGRYKISHHTAGHALDGFDPVGADDLGPDDPDLLAALVSAARRILPALRPEPVATERCIYDNSADGDFVVDRLGPVVIGCGTSGHAFKFGPALGEMLADLVEGTRPAMDPSPFAVNRITGRASRAGDR
jgi:sarcosine oxidase